MVTEKREKKLGEKCLDKTAKITFSRAAVKPDKYEKIVVFVSSLKFQIVFLLCVLVGFQFVFSVF